MSDKPINLEERKAKLAAKLAAKEEAKIPPHIRLALATLPKLGKLLIEDGTIWRCHDNVWKSLDDGSGRRWLEVELEKQLHETTFAKSNAKTIDEARRWIMRNPDIQKMNVPWDEHGKVVTMNEWLDHKSGERGDMSPDLYATRTLPYAYRPDAKCPKWMQFLSDTNMDAETINLLQEYAGMCLAFKRPKQLAKALVLWGPKDTGKSVIVRVLTGMLGGRSINTPISQLEKTHGTSEFICDDPWVLEEAFNQGKWQTSDLVKGIIEGARIPINVKNRRLTSRVYRGAVMWATNHPPTFRESTTAIVERLIVVNMTRIFDADNPTGVARMAADDRVEDLAAYLLACDGEGILAWAYDGLLRVSERGCYILPQATKDILHEIYADSNMVLGFFESGRVIFTPDTKVSASDFCASFAMWWRAEKGEDMRVPSNDSIMRNMKSLGRSDVAIGEDMRSHGKRFIGGIALAKDAIDDWNTARQSNALAMKYSGLSESVDEVNRPWKK